MTHNFTAISPPKKIKQLPPSPHSHLQPSFNSPQLLPCPPTVSVTLHSICYHHRICYPSAASAPVPCTETHHLQIFRAHRSSWIVGRSWSWHDAGLGQRHRNRRSWSHQGLTGYCCNVHLCRVSARVAPQRQTGHRRVLAATACKRGRARRYLNDIFFIEESDSKNITGCYPNTN